MLNHDAEITRRAHALLSRALDEVPDRRRAFVDESSSRDSLVCDEVHRLLDALDSAGGFLETPAWTTPTAAVPRRFDGRTIADFTVLEHAAAGGMGDVYRAEQQSPRRIVALKVVRGGRASDAALRRFAIEGEALGRLHHPHVAQVVSAGVFDCDGERVPYVAMEWIDGARNIARWAAETSLDVGARVTAMLDVCDAVAHAHGRGVIHRDLKPGNVLVGTDDRVKVIDFGVALLADGATRATLDGQFLGTLASMSPEQCRGPLEQVDVRADVYGLGAMLYELLAGQPAFDLSGVPLAQAIRIVTETSPPALVGVPEDLATVVAKALAKDVDDRYVSVEAFARDLRNFLAHRPIEARTPSWPRRARLFVRRHRIGVVATTVTTLAVLVGASAAAVGMVRARVAEGNAERRLEKLETLTTFLTSMFDVEGSQTLGADVTVADQLRMWESRVDTDLAAAHDVRAQVHFEIGRGFFTLGLYADAERHLLQALALITVLNGGESHDGVMTRGKIAMVLEKQNRLKESEAIYIELLPLVDRVLLERPSQREVILGGYAITLHRLERPDEAARILEEILVARRERQPRDDERVAATLGQLGRVRVAQGRKADAEACYREAMAIETERFGAGALRGIATKNNLAVLLRSLGKLDEAEALTRDAYETRLARQGPDHPETLTTQANLAMQLLSLEQFATAVAMLEDCTERHRRILGPRHEDTLKTVANFARSLLLVNRSDEAEAVARELIGDAAQTMGASHWRVAWARAIHGQSLAQLGRADEGRAELDAALVALGSAKGPPKEMVDRVKAWREAIGN
ncbi:MAG: serine/threonine-protein kinase [Phycisphaerae bacterium]|nr:serine/threonine-protein kinase [Phycisphaerae bacterium]